MHVSKSMHSCVDVLMYTYIYIYIYRERERYDFLVGAHLDEQAHDLGVAVARRVEQRRQSCIYIYVYVYIYIYICIYRERYIHTDV